MKSLLLAPKFCHIYPRLFQQMICCVLIRCAVGVLSINDMDGLVQDCSNSIANTLELLQSCTKPSTLCFRYPCCFCVLFLLLRCTTATIEHVILVAINGTILLNSSPPSAAYMRWSTGSSLVQAMACRLFCAKPLPEPMLLYCQLDSWEQVSGKFELKFYHFHTRKCIWKCLLPKWRPFCRMGR